MAPGGAWLMARGGPVVNPAERRGETTTEPSWRRRVKGEAVSED